MKTYFALTQHAMCLMLIPTFTMVGLPEAAQAAADSARSTVSGKVVDEAGKPIAGALLTQQGGLASVFSGADGSFKLALEADASRELVVSAVGYETTTVVPATTGVTVVKLKALQSFIPGSQFNEAPSGTEAIAASSPAVAPLNSGLILAYRFRNQALSDGTATLNGVANNDYRMGFRLRLKPWLLEAEGAHFQTPVDVAGLAREDNPAFSPSTWQLGLRAGRLWTLGENIEASFGAGYRWTNTVPNNRNVAYTGSDIDFEQTRHAFGGVMTSAWHPGGGSWHVEGMLGLYPLVLGTADAPGQPFANSLLTDLRGLVGYEVQKGMRLGAGLQFERWSGRGEDRSLLYSLQLHYTPGGLPAGDAP